MTDTNPEFSVVIACYNEEQSIEEFHARLSATLERLGRTSEIVFVNDGSTDATYLKLEHIFECDPRVAVIIDLFNNSGQQAAITAGIVHTRGDKLVLLDSDLQLDPEELPLLVAESDNGYDAVGACRQNRDDPLSRLVASSVLNRIMRWAIGFPFRDLGCTFRVFDARLVRAFELGPHRVFQLCHTFRRVKRYTEVPVTHHPRKFGRSGWTPWNLLILLVDNLLGFFRRPFLILGLGSLLLALISTAGFAAWWIAPVAIAPQRYLGLILFAVIINILVTLAIVSAVGEFMIRNYAILLRHPAYIIRTIRER